MVLFVLLVLRKSDEGEDGSAEGRQNEVVGDQWERGNDGDDEEHLQDHRYHVFVVVHALCG